MATIGELVALQALTWKDKPYLYLPESGRIASFMEVSDRVSTLSKELLRQGLQPGERIALIFGNGLEAAVCLLGVMAAGLVGVPLNPRLTAEESARLFRQSGVCGILTDVAGRATAIALLAEAGCELTSLTETVAGIVFFRVSAKISPVVKTSTNLGADAPALLLFTSGTTGQPKGVPLTHRNLLANAKQVQIAHRLNSNDRALGILPLFHINGLVMTLLAPLLSSSAVILPQRFQVESFWSLVAQYRATWFSAVPTILSLLLSQPDGPATGHDTLRFARSASAPLPVAVLEAFEERFRVPVIEAYGISEGAGQITSNPLPPLIRKPGSVGIPFGNTLAIVDSTGQPLPARAVGEVVLSGANIFVGYLDNPTADLEVFRDGWFYTGDIGYIDDDGYLFLTGRSKDVINRAGEKIAPREVEEVLHRLPQIEAACVVGLPHPLYGEEPAAFLTLRPGMTLAVDTAQDFCREHLSPFKIPRQIFFIDEFPKGPNGKIQRRLLLDLYQQKTTVPINNLLEKGQR